MKKLFLIIFLFYCVFNSGYTQIQREIKEERIGNHVYRVIHSNVEGETSIWIERATDSLRHLDPGFERSRSMKVEYDRDKLNNLTKKYIVPIIKQSGLTFKDNEYLGTICIFDLEGNIREFSMDFPDKLKIPMKIVDDFFNAVLSSGLTVKYNKEHYGWKNANYVYFSHT